LRFSSRDLDCRYLSILHGERGSFEARSKGLGLHLSSGLLTTLLDRGLLVPALSVQLPARFFEEWEDFPILQGSFSQDLGWAADVWAFATGQDDVWPKRSSLDRESWWVHPFDDPGHDFGNTVRGRRLDARPAPEDATARGARGQRIRALVDFVPYWEAFRLAELLQDLKLFPRVLALAGNQEVAETVLDHLPDLWNDAQDRAARTKQTWADLPPVFDWISRYRTLWAAAIHFEVDRNSIQNAVAKLTGNLNLTPERVREDIREKLLVLWNSWSWKRRSSFSAQLLTSLQYDIAAAVDLLETAFGQPVDPFEEFWDPPYPNPRLWTRLKVALPYEKWQCQETTWQEAPSYLKNCLRVLPLSTVEGHHCLRKLVRQSWPASVNFRRFCVAFARLHEELRTSRVLEGDNYLRLGLPVASARWRRSASWFLYYKTRKYHGVYRDCCTRSSCRSRSASEPLPATRKGPNLRQT